jgi:actin-like protein 6A
MDGSNHSKYVVGSCELAHRRDGMDVQNLVDADGSLKFDILDAILEKSLIENLKVNMLETPILFTENAIHNKDQRMKLTEYMFEKYKIPALFLVKDPVLSAFSCGRSSALILDIGHRSAIATPVNDGYALLKCSIKHDIGGALLTQDLANFLQKKGTQIKPRYTFKKKFINTDGQELMQLIDLSSQVKDTHPNYTNWSQLEIVREMKEDFLSVSEPEPLQMKLSDNARIASYELPDGTNLQLSAYERQHIAEKLFLNNGGDMPEGSISGFSGVHQMIVESISKSDIDIRRDLFQNIILSGGTCNFTGFQKRMEKQLPEVSP